MSSGGDNWKWWYFVLAGVLIGAYGGYEQRNRQRGIGGAVYCHWLIFAEVGKPEVVLSVSQLCCLLSRCRPQELVHKASAGAWYQSFLKG